MSEEYLLAWNDHHSTFFNAMSDLIAGDVLTDVSIWAGHTMFSAHKLVLALSSSYFRFVVTQSSVSEGKYPVIFLKDITSREFERLLAYMYNGEVSVPQSELLSLISAAKSLGIRGLTNEEGELLADEEPKDSHHDIQKGIKRGGDNNMHQSLVKKHRHSFPKLHHKNAMSSKSKHLSKKEKNGESTKEDADESVAERNHNRSHTGSNINVQHDEKTVDEKSNSTTNSKLGKERVEEEDKEVGNDLKDESPKGGVSTFATSFLEVNVKQEEEDTEEQGFTENSDDYNGQPPSLTPLPLVRRSLLPPGLLGPAVGHHSRHSITTGRGSAGSEPRGGRDSATTIQRNTGTCHFCGRSFMKNKQLMNHVCPMRPQGK